MGFRIFAQTGRDHTTHYGNSWLLEADVWTNSCGERVKVAECVGRMKEPSEHPGMTSLFIHSLTSLAP